MKSLNNASSDTSVPTPEGHVPRARLDGHAQLPRTTNPMSNLSWKQRLHLAHHFWRTRHLWRSIPHDAHPRRQHRDLAVRQNHYPIRKSELMESRGIDTCDFREWNRFDKYGMAFASTLFWFRAPEHWTTLTSDTDISESLSTAVVTCTDNARHPSPPTVLLAMRTYLGIFQQLAHGTAKDRYPTRFPQCQTLLETLETHANSPPAPALATGKPAGMPPERRALKIAQK